MAQRQIVHIDEEKCNGCGLCTRACAEGALAIVDGKARLVSETYCDGLGACLGECPQGAISIDTREAAAFDEEAVKEHLAEIAPVPCNCPSMAFTSPAAHAGCPGSRVQMLREADAAWPPTSCPGKEHDHQPSSLRHWPVQLALVPVNAPFLQGAELLMTADCVPFAYAGFHRELLPDKAVVVGCPKLDDVAAYQLKLTQMLRQSDIRAVTVVRMEVPCCSGLVAATQRAIMASGKEIPFSEIVIGIAGDRLS